jgi:DNA-binding HxlR family transcriptional regulator
MLPRTYDDQNCSIARALEVVGERWTLLVLREISRGAERFEDLQSGLGIARNVLSARLARLCEEGVLERRRYQERPERFSYHLTEKGADLVPVLVLLLAWGDRYAAPDGPPVVLLHGDDGHPLEPTLSCARCGEQVEGGPVRAVAGPGARAG